MGSNAAQEKQEGYKRMIVSTIRPEGMTHHEYKEKVLDWGYLRDFDSIILLRRRGNASAMTSKDILNEYWWQIECDKEGWTMFALTWSPKILEE